MRTRRSLRLITTATAISAAALLAGCGASSRDTTTTGAKEEAGRGWVDGPPPSDPKGGGGGDDLAAMAAPSGAADTAGPGSASSPAAPGSAVTAGSTDDNDRFDDYLRYRRSAPTQGLHPVDVEGRRVVRVKAADGHPVLGARVRIGDVRAPLLDARTHADGRVLFFPRATPSAGAGPWNVTVDVGGSQRTATLTGDGGDLVVDAAPTAADPTKLDVVFLLDATGSMGDELDRLTEHMAATATKVAAAAGPGSTVRFGLTAFRDQGDAYVTRTFDLTADHAAFKRALGEVKAGGGGDTPEALPAGLHEAITKPRWGGDDVAKVIVLVGDAGPHTDDRQEPDEAADARLAADRGIRLHAIASSGLDDAGEFTFRQLALLTAGKFVFLTYGADGGPGGSTPHHVDKYAVKPLDELVATLLIEELRPAGAPGGQQQP